jgi:CubicO group peptidase (beta-lactamase class C family)
VGEHGHHERAQLLHHSQQLDTHLTALHDRDEFDGFAMVTLGGEPVLAKGYGFANAERELVATPQTAFRIGSITKQFTAMAIMILQERGAVRVTDSVGDHLDDIPEHWQGLMVHQLLTHTSGLMHSWALPGFTETMAEPRTLDETLRRFYDQPLVFEPGNGDAYSGVGYFLLAQLIEELSGLEYEEFLRVEIFEPLGMNNTGADTPDVVPVDRMEGMDRLGRLGRVDRATGYVRDGGVQRIAPEIHMPILTGGGNLYSSAEDLTRWDQALGAGELISAESYEAMYLPERSNRAYGWLVTQSDGYRVIRHGGGVPGFTTHIYRVPEAALCVVVLGNVQPVVSGQIAAQLAGMMLEGR